MMRKLFALTFCMGSFAAYAQEEVAIITARLDKSPNDTVVNLYEPYSGDTASTVIKNHQFRLTMPMSKGGSVYIMQIGSNPELGGALVYLEKGKMNITGKGGYFKDATFSGDSWVKEWEEVMDLTSPDKGDGKLFAELEQKYHKAMEIGDEDAAEAYSKQGSEVEKRQKDILRKWVLAHPNSGVTGYIITVYFSKDNKEMEALYDGLGEHAKAGRILQRWKNPGKVDPSLLSLKMNEEGETPGRPGQIKIGDAAPAFTIPDVNGKMVSLGDFKGKYVLVDFWASWCGPCRQENPNVVKAYNKYKDKNFTVLGVSLDRPGQKDNWVKAINDDKLAWTNVSDLQFWNSEVVSLYGFNGIPFNILVDPQGKVIAEGLRGETLVAKLGEVLR